MAVAIPYNTGTASVNAGSTTVAGQGTTWLASGIRPGDLFWAAGLSVRIAAVNSNTSLTLAYPWPGANQSASAYEIRLTPEGELVYAASRRMLTELESGGLSPLSGLTPAANKMLLYTGAATATLIDATTQAQTLLSGTALSRSGTNYTLDGRLLGQAVTQSQTDTTGGRLMKTNDFGLGYAITLTAADNLDNLTASGLYYNPTGANTTGNNYPISSAGALYVCYSQTNRHTQMFVSYGGNSTAAGLSTFIRSYGNSGWTPWCEIIHQGTILRPVGQSGGVPTGGVMQRGSNANGDWVKFADGTQIATSSVTATYDINTAAGSAYVSAVIGLSLPINFLSLATTSVSISPDQLAVGNIWVGFQRASAVGAAQCRLMASSSLAGQTVGLKITAVGRWF
ncbi:pyocin knob domain-containing protein [Shinella sp. BYT-45]|uniref:pyocin knob domain-containing protein n=1 Tax=Shinella sp. BYT-45 TaxID=3377377 RepID=UPI0039801480